MKREKKQQRVGLLVSVDRIRQLTSDDLRRAGGGQGKGWQPIPCSHSVGSI